MGLHMSTPGFILLPEFEGIDIELLHPSKPAKHFPWSMETAQLETSSSTNHRRFQPTSRARTHGWIHCSVLEPSGELLRSVRLVALYRKYRIASMEDMLDECVIVSSPCPKHDTDCQEAGKTCDWLKLSQRVKLRPLSI
ncbi:unnamed protein product [Cladocopium goreaui]|uniref:Uncharacterized protein n=1 Tax=Cladocopium goreaui TaxID=2562237 RepID=A0A9P1CBH3_9DINO|nr:unnamed protein product [Cladocopium goreaui]